MEARIINFRRSKHNQKTNYVVISIEDESKLKELIGKEVVYKTKSGKEIKGKITNLHGKHALRVLFEKGLPGQALGKKVEIR